jgi:DNA-3-methyladenine glycosylase II
MTLQQKDMHGFSFKHDVDEIPIQTPKHFSFSEAMVYLSRSPLECLHRVKGEKVYKLLETDDNKVLVEIGEKNENELRVRCVNGALGSPEQVKDYIEDWLDLNRDIIPFYELAEKDEILRPLMEEYDGLRIIGIPDLFEALCWAVIGQQVNLPFAYTVKKRLVESYGASKEWNDECYWLFPQPKVIAKLTVDDLKELQLTGRKSEYIIHIAKLICAGELSKGSLLKLDHELVEKQLLAIRGIGPWTAHYVLMRCLRDPSAFPIGDAGLQNALKHLMNKSTKPSLEEMRELFKPWEGWEGYAVFYLWRSLYGKV